MAEVKHSNVDMLRTGVYCITNTQNGRKYIGSAAASFNKRWRKHQDDLRRGKHHSQHLQRAWDKYGEVAFHFQIVAFCEARKCVAIEQLWINCLRTSDAENGYNISPTAGSVLGMKRSDENRRKLSEVNTGKKASIEARKNMSLAQRGKKQSQDTIEKRVAKIRGRKRESPSQEIRDRISKSLAGRTRSPEAIAKCNETKRLRPMSEEARARISKAMTGRKKSPEAIAKSAASRTGQKKCPLTPEHREKISKALTGRKKIL